MINLLMPGLVLIAMIWSFGCVVYWLAKTAEWLENAGRPPEIHIHNHPVQREVYVSRIIEKERRIFLPR